MKQTIVRAVASVGIVAAALVAATRTAEAQSTYNATANTGTGVVTFTGSASNDSALTFVNAAGVLTHNQTGNGFTSFVDMDNVTPLDQTIMVASLTSLTINAGDGDDAVVLTGLTGVPVTAVITVNGEGGDDVLTGGPAKETFTGGPGNDLISPGSANGEANTLDGGGGADSLVLAGDAAGNVIAISRTGGTLSITIDGAVSTATYSNLETASVTGLTGNDTFTVEPLDDLSYTLDGGGDADTLNVDAGGRVVVQTSTTITVAGRLPIGHTGFETVNVANPGFAVGDDDDSGCGLLGVEALLLLVALARLLRARP